MKFAVAAACLIALTYSAYALWSRPEDDGGQSGIASGNGRLEAREYDVATQFAGRLLELSVREGDSVQAGQVVGRMDTASLDAQLREAQAQQRQAMASAASAKMLVRQREAEWRLAQHDAARYEKLYASRTVAADQFERSRTAEIAASVAVQTVRSQITATQASVEAAQASVERIQSQLAEADLKAPVSGRVLYRLAEPGEVLAGGGRVATVLDLTDVYLTVFLPTGESGRLAVGADARVVLDAADGYVFPAHVSFVSPEAQFTPKEVETRSERDKLMFRVKVQLDRELLQRYVTRVKTGLPGVAYVRTRSDAIWPDRLAVKLPPTSPQ